MPNVNVDSIEQLNRPKNKNDSDFFVYNHCGPRMIDVAVPPRFSDVVHFNVQSELLLQVLRVPQECFHFDDEVVPLIQSHNFPHKFIAAHLCNLFSSFCI